MLAESIIVHILYFITINQHATIQQQTQKLWHVWTLEVIVSLVSFRSSRSRICSLYIQYVSYLNNPFVIPSSWNTHWIFHVHPTLLLINKFQLLDALPEKSSSPKTQQYKNKRGPHLFSMVERSNPSATASSTPAAYVRRKDKNRTVRAHSQASA